MWTIAAAAIAAAAHLASVQLPANLNLYSVQPDGKNLLVIGDTATGGHCVFVRVSEVPLRVIARGSGDCSRTSAELIHPVLEYDPRSFTVRVRIARAGGEGPVVMTFQQYSDTHLETAYGPGSLWLFDSETSKGAEVVQVSTRTGRVENIVAMPKIYRPFLAADSDGLWLAIAPNGGAPRGLSPIYLVVPGARAPKLIHRSGRAALWIVADRHTVVADVLSGTRGQELWRFDGDRARKLAPATELNNWAANVSTDGSTVWTVREVPENGNYIQCDALQVIRIDAATGAQAVAATIRTPGSHCYGVTYSTFADGAFAFLDGHRLFRVTA
ncbi:MAG TPA: hypothetical protein VKR23_13385 [Gaiellaceae bacterium]|nr:hypothetical protein [Gaiellaceae bacterium]